MHHEQKTLACREQGYIGTLYDLERTTEDGIPTGTNIYDVRSKAVWQLTLSDTRHTSFHIP